MTRRLLTLAALLVSSCVSAPRPVPPPVAQPGRAQLQVFVEPNPIVARHVSGNTYDFPFEIAVVERNGVGVEVQRVGIEVTGLGFIGLYSKTYGRDEIARKGYPTSIEPGGELRYRFNPRQEVTDERLFSAVAAELFAEGIDANGNSVRATTRVTVTR